MSDEERNAGDAATGTAAAADPSEQPYLDEHTTEPNASTAPREAPKAAGSQWKMPEPKFQQTSGYLPQGYLKEMEAAAAASKTSSDPDIAEEQPVAVAQSAASQSVPDIEPQPDLAEQLIVEDTAPKEVPAVAPSSSGGRAIGIVIGLLIILALAAAFLAAVYYLFLAKPAEGQF